jgi:fucose permease
MRRVSSFGITAAICVIFATYGVTLFLVGPCLTAIAATYGVALKTVGSLFAAWAIGFVPAALLLPAVSQRLGRKATLAVGLGVAVVAMGFFALAPQIRLGPPGAARPWFGFAFIAMLLSGVGAAAIEAMANGIASDANPGREAFALNLVHAFFAVGAVIGPMIAAFLLPRPAGWQLAYGISAAVFALSLVVLLPQQCPPHPAEEFDPLAALRMLRIGAVALGLVGIILYVSAEAGLSGWLSGFMENALGADKATAARSVALLWATMTLGRFICTALANLLPAAIFVVVLAGGAGLSAVGIAFSRSVFTCYLGAAAVGLFMSSIFAMVLADVGAHVRGRAPTAFSIVVLGVGAGMFFVPPAMGWLAEITGSLRIALGVPALLMIALAAAYAIAHLARRR